MKDPKNNRIIASILLGWIGIFLFEVQFEGTFGLIQAHTQNLYYTLVMGYTIGIVFCSILIKVQNPKSIFYPKKWVKFLPQAITYLDSFPKVNSHKIWLWVRSIFGLFTKLGVFHTEIQDFLSPEELYTQINPNKILNHEQNERENTLDLDDPHQSLSAIDLDYHGFGEIPSHLLKHLKSNHPNPFTKWITKIKYNFLGHLPKEDERVAFFVATDSTTVQLVVVKLVKMEDHQLRFLHEGVEYTVCSAYNLAKWKRDYIIWLILQEEEPGFPSLMHIPTGESFALNKIRNIYAPKTIQEYTQLVATDPDVQNLSDRVQTLMEGFVTQVYHHHLNGQRIANSKNKIAAMLKSHETKSDSKPEQKSTPTKFDNDIDSLFPVE